jgi:hypothetical protein
MFSPKKLLVFVLLVVILICFALFAPKSKSVAPEKIVTLTSGEYSLVKITLLALVNEKTPRDAMLELREMGKQNPVLLRSCHDLAHEIGHESFVKYSDFAKAVEFRDEFCNSGYLHGVIESHFKSSADIYLTMKSTCAEYPVGKFLSWECYHGIGHGLMYYSNNNLPESIRLCSTYDDEFVRNSCINGVFMENFNADQQLHYSQYVDSKDIFSTCRNLENGNKHNCYTYAPVYYMRSNADNYMSIFDFCKNAENGYATTCRIGAGSQLMKNMIDEPMKVEELCEQSDYLNNCISGMMYQYVAYYGNLESAREICGKFRPKNQGICLTAVNELGYLF